MAPIDLKTQIKQFLTDKEGLNKPTLPSSAMIVGDAEGHNGNRAGVYGHSERAVAIYGESVVFAGFFEGDVQVNGQLAVDSGDVSIADDLIVNGKMKGKFIEQVLQRLIVLEASIGDVRTAIESKITRFGMPVHPPESRPSLAVTELMGFGKRATFLVSGQGFGSFGHIVFHIVNNTKGVSVPLIGEINDLNNFGASAFGSDKNGTLVSHARLTVEADVNDELSIVATDGRGDANDMTGFLWSNTETHVVI